MCGHRISGAGPWSAPGITMSLPPAPLMGTGRAEVTANPSPRLAS